MIPVYSHTVKIFGLHMDSLRRALQMWAKLQIYTPGGWAGVESIICEAQVKSRQG